MCAWKATKHVFAGTTRVASKLQPGTVPSRGGGKGGGGNGGGGGTTPPPDTEPPADVQLPPGLDKRDELPPGLAKRDELPPGLAKGRTTPPGHGGPNPGKGREKRSEQGAAHARDVEQNPTLTGGKTQSPVTGTTAPAKPTPPGQANKAGRIVVDVRAAADRTVQQVGGQATSFDGEAPGEFLYFFHPDHLGSTSYVTDEDGAVYEHVQYFPFGET